MKYAVMTDVRTQIARDLAEYLEDNGMKVLTPPDGCRLWKEEEVRAFAAGLPGPLAGVIHPAPPLFQRSLEEADEESAARARDEGPLAAWCVTRVFSELLEKNGGGSLIYLNSVHAEKPLGYGFLFSGGCGAVQMLSREVNQDAGTRGVRSFFIQRGPMRGDPDLRSDITPFYYGTDQRYPTGITPGSESLCGLVSFLLTEEAAILSGSDLRADGGMTMYYGRRADTAVAPKEFAPFSHETMPWPDPAHEDRVALVTGSGKGVGAGIVRFLCRTGMRCVINCNSNPAMAEKTLAQVLAEGGEAFLCQADVSTPEGAEKLIRETTDRYGRLDVLVNNAALQRNRFVDQYTEESLRQLWDINFLGYWRMIRGALPWLRKSPMPRIINIGSVHGKRPTCFDAGYAMTKGAVKMLTREAALELQAGGHPVNCLQPGRVPDRVQDRQDPLYADQRPGKPSIRTSGTRTGW